MVIYQTGRTDKPLVRRASRWVSSGPSGGDEQIGAGFGGLNANVLAGLMNRYRRAAVERNRQAR